MKEDKGLTLAEFQPAEAELAKLATKAQGVNVGDIAQVHDVRIELRDTRIAVTKKGKDLRDGALQFQKAVIAKEKQLLAIIAPDEDRLAAIEEEAKAKAEMEKRRSELPSRKAAIEVIGIKTPCTDDELLSMDDAQFNEHRLNLIEVKLANDKATHEAKVKADEDAARARQAEADRIAREKLDAERAEFEKNKKDDEDKRHAEQAEIEKEKARLAGIEEERQREEAAKKAEIDRQEREAKLKSDKEEAEAFFAKKEKEEQEAKAEYQAWLAEIKYDPARCIIRTEGDKLTAYREIGTYTLKK